MMNIDHMKQNDKQEEVRGWRAPMAVHQIRFDAIQANIFALAQSTSRMYDPTLRSIFPDFFLCFFFLNLILNLHQNKPPKI